MLIKNISVPIFTGKHNQIQKNTHNQTPINQGLTQDIVTFKGRNNLSAEEKYQRALDIVDCFSKDQIQNMDDFDQKHLDGIQYGLKSFENLSFPQIYFILSNMGEITIPVVRDCSGMCPACYVNGRPKERNKDAISRMDFEDFKNLTNDIKEITHRLNFNCVEKSTQKSIQNTYGTGYYTLPSSALFYDSDGKDVWLQDEKGTIHEFPELNKMLYDATGLKGLFDTAGWSPKNSVVQKRIENIVKYYSNPEHEKEIDQINISVNTYHGIMQKANEYKNKGDIESYNRMKKAYINNIVNAMYTCTPLVEKDCYQILIKAADDRQGEGFKDYNKDAIFNLIKEIISTLHIRYMSDIENNNYKYAKTEEDVVNLVSKHIKKFSPLITSLSPSTRDNIFATIDDDYDYIKDQKNVSYDDVTKQKLSSILIDVNGKVYLQNDHEVFKTDICLNFKNKDKEAKQIYPLPDKRTINTKEKIFN